MAKINELSLEFHADKFYDDLISHLVLAISEVARELEDEFRSASGEPRIADSWVTLMLAHSDEMILYAVGNDHWYAFIDNYGKGKTMANESQNPFLRSYMDSRVFNSTRTQYGNATLVRPYNSNGYLTPDWDSGDGYTNELVKGNYAHSYYDGTPKDLGELAKRIPKLREYADKMPKFWLENGMKKIDKRFNDAIMEALETFPAYSNKYIEGGV